MKDRILALVVEKTGYPIDMLDLDLDWKPILGSTRSSRRKSLRRFARPMESRATKTVKLRDYPTLAHVIRFVEEHRAGVVAHGKSSTKQAQHPRSTPEVKPSRTGSGGYRLPRQRLMT